HATNSAASYYKPALPFLLNVDRLLPDAGFHEDELGQLRADGEARVADQTDEIRLTRQQPDDLFLAQAQFAQTILNLRGGADLFDTNSHSRAHASERTDLASGCFACSKFGTWLNDVHSPSLLQRTVVHYTDFAIR